MTTEIKDNQLNQLQNTLLESLSAHVIVIDADGEILANNQNWEPCEHQDADCLRSQSGVGNNYLDLCKNLILQGNDHALKTKLGLKAVLNGEKEEFILTYPSHSSAGDHGWVKLKALPLDEQCNSLVIVQEETNPSAERDRKLRESEERYRRQFENSLEGILITTTNGRFVDANPTACRLLKYSKQELLELTWKDIVETSHPGFQDALKQRKKTGSYHAEFPMMRGDMELITVEALSQTYRNEMGEIRSTLYFRDITARKKTEQELESEKKFTDSAVKSIPGIFFVMDEEGELVRWNENVLHSFGYDTAELEEMNAFDLVHPEDRDRARRAVAQILKKGHGKVELRTCSKNGDISHYIYHGNKLQTDGQSYVVGTGIDITAQKEAEAATHRHQEMMDQLFENSPIGIAMINKEHEIMRTNKSFTDIFGYSPQEAAGQNIDELLINDAIKNEAQTLSEQGFKGDTFQVDTVRVAKDGTKVPVLVGGVPVEIDDELIVVYGMYADISERKKLEEQIRTLLENEKEARLSAEKAKIRLEEIFASAPSAICILEGPEHTFTYANKAYEKLIGKQNFINSTVEEVLPEVKRQGFVELLDEVYSTGEPYNANEAPIMLNQNGNDEPEQVFLNFTYKPLTDENQQVYGIFVEAIDVTEQVNNRKKLSRSLLEKKVLIKEIHHRVKNNLALISSMIELQLEESQNWEQGTQALYATRSRVHTIAKIHELIYQYEDFSNIPFHEYLQEMAGFSQAMHGPNSSPLEINLDLRGVLLNINQAIPFGLLINEIIGKVEQHVQMENSHTLSISLRKEQGTVHLNMDFKDLALSRPICFEEINSLNGTLTKTLLQQLGAALKSSTPSKTRQQVSLAFAISDRKGPASQLN